MQAIRAKLKNRLRPGSAVAEEPADRIDWSVIKNIQKEAATPGCVLHVSILGEKARSFTKASNIALPGLSDVRPVSEDSLLAIGSLQKTCISIALYLIIEEGLGLKEQEPDVRSLMKNAWDKDAFDIFNYLLKKRKERRIIKPTIPLTLERLLRHESALPTHQRYLWGPESSFMLSDSLFEDIVTEMADMEPPRNEQLSRYSNWNYILAGSIVQLACDSQSLADALHSTIFARFNMLDTIVRPEDYETRQNEIADPVATTVETSTGFKILKPHYLSDTASLACGGGISCVKDLAKVLKWVLQQLIQENGSRLQDLLEVSAITDVYGSYASTMLGIHTEIDSPATGSQSYDHEWQKVEYTLGKHKKGSIRALSKAGAVRGFSCHYYLIPAAQMFFIVMANSSGILDASNHISQYLLHCLLGLPGELDIVRHVQNIREQKLKALRANIAIIRKGKQLSFSNLTDYRGVYSHKHSKLRLVIWDRADRDVDIYLQYQDERRTKPLVIQIAPTGDLFLFPRPEDDSIETYGPWQGYKFEVHRSDTAITKLVGIAGMDEDEQRAVFERE